MRVLGGDMRLEELTEIPVFQVFHHHAVRFFAVAGTQDAGDIAILQSSQDPHVSLEVQPVRQKRFLVSRKDQSEERELPKMERLCASPCAARRTFNLEHAEFSGKKKKIRK